MATADLNNVNSLLRQIEQVQQGAQSGSCSSNKGMQTYNDIAWFANSVVALGEGATPEQKASFFSQLCNKAFSMLDSLTNNEAQKARKEVQEETKKAQQLDQKSQELQAELEGDLSDIQSNINSQTAIIDDAQGLLKESQEKLQEKQKEIEQKVQEIEKEKEKLNDPKLSIDEKLQILANIQGYVTEVADKGLEIQTITEDVNSLASAVKNTVEDVEKSTERLAKTEEAGIQELANKANEAATQVTEVGKTSTKGATNQAQEKVLDQAADKASTNAVTGSSIAIKLRKSASDQGQAADSRLGSIANNLSTLAQGIGKMNNASQILSTFQNAIGGALDSYAGSFEKFETAIQPTIEGLGSFAENFTPGLEELNGCVEEDIETLNSAKEGSDNSQPQSVEPSKETSKSTGKSSSTTPATPASSGTSTVEDKEDTSENNNEVDLKTPEFEMKKLTFGV